MIYLNALDYNECRSEEDLVISFFWRSVYIWKSPAAHPYLNPGQGKYHLSRL